VCGIHWRCGLASSQKPDGTFFFALPLNTTLGSKLGASSDQAHLLQDTQLIIWVQVLMQNKQGMEAVVKCLCDITKVNNLFSGIPVVLGGNSVQILPIVPRGCCGDINNACLH
jgi:hypothetical protein